MKPMTDQQAMEAAYSLADEIRAIVEQSLFVEDKATNQSMQIVLIALCRVLGDVIGSASVDRKMVEAIAHSLQSTIVRFGDDMRKDMETVRRMAP